ncbi:uncharacterized protein At4g26450 [Arachis duranensis]|uniref:Uncharacterized protein At4g26450 n=1 Tax=Arachis duranensis TaxID=130453 RepID=A0A6P4DJB0_ARADU|nr:uncharacterized protein At4g26450 [Arachis duranensis]
MHPRQRSPRGFYATSDYRHLNRDSSFSRPHPNPKPFSHPPPPAPPPPPSTSSSSRRVALLAGGDIFVEAGRLAAEYLVSQGLLPPNALSFKWQQNNSFKKHGGGAGGGEFPVEGGGRTSALARLGNTVATDIPSGRRKMGFDDFGQKGSRRRGSFRGNGLDWGGREFRRNGSWSDRSRYTPERKDNDDADDSFSRHKDEDLHQQQHRPHQIGVAADVDKPKSDSNDTVPSTETGDTLHAEGDNDMLSGESMDLKQTSSADGKDKSDVDVEVAMENASAGVMDVKDGTADDDDTEKSGGSKNLSVQSSDQESNEPITDLLSLFKSIKVPTKPRSLRGHKNLKGNPQQNVGDEDTHDAGDLQGPQVLAENVSVKVSSAGDLLSDVANASEHLESNMSNVEPDHDDVDEDLKELDTACNAEVDQSIGTDSGQDLGYMHDNNREPSATLLDHGSCGSMSEERGEKRVAEVDDLREESKRVKEWLPSLPPRTEGYFETINTIGMKEITEEDDLSHLDKVAMTSDQGSLMTTSQFTEVGDRSILHCSEEKQSLPSSFRTCDLNLMEASEVHENQANHPILIYPPVSETKKAVPVDIDLTVSRTSIPGKFSTQSTTGKEIEVIDLECDSTQEEKPIDNMERKSEAMFSGLEGFSNHAPSTADIHDVQDGYGLMLSELLGADFPNCSSVSTDINSVHNEMGLHNGTVPMGTLAEDDSIYMSLGEIPLPLGFLRPWEQPPPQDYQKPF